MLGAALQILDLFAHAVHLLFFFSHAQLQTVFGIELCLVTNCDEGRLHFFLDRQIEFAARIVQVPLLAEQIGLRLLRFLKFDVAVFQNVLKLADLLRLAIEIARRAKLGLLRFLGGDGFAFGLQTCPDLLFDRRLLTFYFRLAIAKRGLARPDRLFFVGNDFLIPLACRRDQRTGERFVELDLGAAVRAGNGRIAHSFPLTAGLRIVLLRFERQNNARRHLPRTKTRMA